MTTSIKLQEEFSELTNQKLKNTSLLKLHRPLIDLDDKTNFINIFRSYITNLSIIDSSRYYTYHEVGNNEWLDVISYQYYETDNLWWVIALVNNIVNPFEDFGEGIFIKILKSEYIYKILREIEKVGEI